MADTFADHIMHRLRAVAPMPRGERIAKAYEHNSGKTRYFVPLWGRLIDRSRVLLMLDEAFGLAEGPFIRRAEPAECAARWRAYAAPLRNARVKIARLKSRLANYGGHKTDCRSRYANPYFCDCGWSPHTEDA